jgi:hypothetical protein
LQYNTSLFSERSYESSEQFYPGIYRARKPENMIFGFLYFQSLK